MSRWSDGLGRTIIIAAIAGTLFAGFLALAPQLTASNTEAAPTTTLAVQPTTSLPGISDPVVAVPIDGADEGTGDVTAPDEVTTTTTIAATTTTTTMAPTTTTQPTTTTLNTLAVEDAGAAPIIELTVDARNAADVDPDSVLEHGDEIEWRFTVTNVSDEDVWGTYAYLELHGPASCEEHHLRPGEATNCWIETTAVEGSYVADVWATAWTTEHIVEVGVLHPFEVIG